jgi:predicted SprT family Zn-dependent metalloprotease
MTFRLPNSGNSATTTDAGSGFENPGDDLTKGQLRSAIRDYAETVEIDVPLDEVEIDISNRLQRTAGLAIRKNNQMKMRFAWKAYQSWGWGNEWEEVIRHELIHIWEYVTFDEAGHGHNFKAKAAELDAPRHCPTFAEDDAKWFIRCSECGNSRPRFRRSKIIDNPERYRSGCCGAAVEVDAT